MKFTIVHQNLLPLSRFSSGTSKESLPWLDIALNGTIISPKGAYYFYAPVSAVKVNSSSKAISVDFSKLSQSTLLKSLPGKSILRTMHFKSTRLNVCIVDSDNDGNRYLLFPSTVSGSGVDAVFMPISKAMESRLVKNFFEKSKAEFDFRNPGLDDNFLNGPTR